GVGVLELVDQDEAVALAQLAPRLRVLAQQRRGSEQQVLEVQPRQAETLRGVVPRRRAGEAQRDAVPMRQPPVQERARGAALGRELLPPFAERLRRGFDLLAVAPLVLGDLD